MKAVRLPGTQIALSRFVFGTASLFNAGDAATRQRLLDAAADHGFSHFDTAPYYGFGMAERDLAPLLARRRDLTVTTKVGIYSPGGEEQGAGAIFLRKAAGRFMARASRPEKSWDVDRARAALTASLRRLGRDHIELYLLHEPEFAQVDQHAWTGWLESEVAAGRIGQYGLAAEPAYLAPFLATRSPLTGFVQTTDSLGACEADCLTAAGLPLQITYGYISSALRSDSCADVPDILARALRRNPDGAVIVSTRKVSRMQQFADIAAAA